MEYVYETLAPPDITIDPQKYKIERYPQYLPYKTVEYLESGFQFYEKLLEYNGFMLHASAIEYCGKAYLFSGISGVGKSTHTMMWKKLFEEAQIFNDDKPALRYLNDCWYVYGTPWCGKDGINKNIKVLLGGICFLKQGQVNRIRRLSAIEALPKLLAQTLRKRLNRDQTQMLLVHLEKLMKVIPIYELENRPEPEAARLSYETMRRGAEEAGL